MNMKKYIMPAVVLGTCLLSFAAASQVFAQGPEVNGELRTLLGRIRWKKTMGLTSKTPRGIEPTDKICAQFFVVVTQPSTGSEKPIQYDIALDDKPEASKPDYYSCYFEMKVPSNVLLNVFAGMGNGLAWPNSERSPVHYKYGWIGDGRAGQLRAPRIFKPEKREVRLGNKPMLVNFELVYEQ
ncbi:MAG: hypothetical protein ABL952_11930 [Pyrinomonadaceae bacterium]